LKKDLKVKFTDGLHLDYFESILAQRYNIIETDKPDFLFFNCHSFEHLRHKNCVKIFMTNECCTPNFNECDYAIAHDYIEFGDRYLRFPYYYRNFSLPEKREPPEPKAAQRKFCNFVYSNAAGGTGAKLRIEFCKELMKYKKVDCAGRILNNISGAIEPREGSWERGKLDFVRGYKFTISFENTMSEGYTTEKLIHPLQARSIPIYWGNPAVVRDFNPRAFINCNDYGNDLADVARRVAELDSDDGKYLEMLSEPPMREGFDFNQDARLADFLFKIIERGNRPLDKDPMGFAGMGSTSVSKLLFYKAMLMLPLGKKKKYYARKLDKMRGNIKF